MASRIIRIATRSSPMAVAQAEQVAADIARSGVETELVKVTSAGDRWMGDLAKLGGKGAFVKEIDDALLNDEADLAVHCLKDIPGDIPIPEGIAFAGFPKRDDVRDAIITKDGRPLAEQPPGTVVGTSSVRRAAQLRLHYPELVMKPLRGNMNTRLQRLEDGYCDVLIAAVAGMHRINRVDRITEILPLEVMCPPIGAGVLTLACRAEDDEVRELAGRLDHAETRRVVDAERAMLHALQGHCNSPIAGICVIEPTGRLSLHGKVFDLEGTRWLDSQQWGVPEDPQALGFFVGADLLRQGARAIIDSIPH
ncbi:hydroxymethylbilane synthase [Nocardia sp. NBC_01329]|uniref:hydroxymethylbilane synthase n=1 Tax=Nocardia sp. NBC_01329 TaxID=2903594 RepID=UPI002E1631AB|nr:hydroxymethylbilane synthase [Nocardia sp. NBC_01329]